MHKSWKTTTAGLLALVPMLFAAISAQFDSDPNTHPQWEYLISAVAIAFGLSQARDKNVSSEAQGVKSPAGD